jgi:hypothetical protein
MTPKLFLAAVAIFAAGFLGGYLTPKSAESVPEGTIVVLQPDAKTGRKTIRLKEVPAAPVPLQGAGDKLPANGWQFTIRGHTYYGAPE